jgi:prepilin-type processing-associated H-X9-DG protein
LPWACPTATHYSLAHTAFWRVQGGGLEAFRDKLQLGSVTQAGEPVYYVDRDGRQHNINPDLGPDCPYNEAFYTDDNTNWYGFRVLPERAIYEEGASRFANRPNPWSGNGDLDAATYETFERARQFGPNVDTDLVDRVFRLREGVERFFITDIENPAASMMAQSTLPVLFDGWATSLMQGEIAGRNQDDEPMTLTFNHVPGGSNVLFMDGHVEFIRYEQTTRNNPRGRFPVTNGAYGSGAKFAGHLVWGLLGKG